MARLYLMSQAVNEDLQERRRRRKRIRDERIYETLIDVDFITEYRLNKTLFEELCAVLVPLLPVTKYESAIDPVAKILTALNFFAAGCYQTRVGKNEDAPMAQTSVSRCIRDVSDALCSRSITKKYLKFPQNLEERTEIKTQFYNRFGLPGVCGCIDCTHIKIVKPTDYEERFFNRKLYHSLNVQMICDAENYITNVDASYGGSNHDSFIWANSPIKSHLEAIASRGETAYLLGDAGYPLREYLITPFPNVQQGARQQFNLLHKKTRATIERTFGILKGRFRCLLAARELHYCPERAAKITVACSVLHNMCMRESVPFPELTAEEQEEERGLQPATTPPPPAPTPAQTLRRGQRMRNNIVQLISRNNRQN